MDDIFIFVFVSFLECIQHLNFIEIFPDISMELKNGDKNKKYRPFTHVVDLPCYTVKMKWE